ncbi:MAG: NADH-quinone oxidoreductase subunit J [bacterium]
MIEQAVFYILASVILFSALGVVLMRSVMHSALCLGLCLAGVAGIFASLGADFLFVAQILVYVGGIAVLILFVVLLAARASDRLLRQINEQWMAALLICGLFLWTFWKTAGYFAGIKIKSAPAPTVRAIANMMLGEYAVPFELISLVLLASMVGAVLFGRRKAE